MLLIQKNRIYMGIYLSSHKYLKQILIHISGHAYNQDKQKGQTAVTDLYKNPPHYQTVRIYRTQKGQ